MNLNAMNIGLVCDDDQRIDYLVQQINDPRRKIVSFNFKDIDNKYIKFDGFDLLIFDLPSCEIKSIKSIFTLRSQRDLSVIPFIYIVNDNHIDKIEDLIKDKPSSIINDPFTQAEIESLVGNMGTLANLQKRQDSNHAFLANENKLIYQFENILQLEALDKMTDQSGFFVHLQKHVRHKLELTFSAEKSHFLEFDSPKKQLVLNQFNEKTEKIEKTKAFSVQNSRILGAIAENSPMIFNEEMLLDPFIQELEDLIGFEINSLLFVPLTVFHQIRGAFILINKVNRKSFAENDLALALIILGKIVYRMENLFLNRDKNNNPDNEVPGDGDQEEQQFCKDILDSIGFGLIIFNQNYQLKYINSFARKTLQSGEIGTKKLSDILGDEAYEIVDSLIKAENIPLLRQEMLVKHPGNRQLYLGYSLYSIDQSLENQSYALTFMEISQTKRLQAEIIRMDRMASLGVLASGIAHEIRNPLAGIKAMAQTLQEELDVGDPKNEYIDRIVRQVNRLDELLKSFFSYARPQRPNPVRCKIPDIVHEVLPLFRRKIKMSNIIVKEVYSRDLKEIFVDFHQIEQVFFNLIINAIDAMNKGGTLTIRARLPEETTPIIDRRQRIPKLFSDIYNEITISDTGLGMDNETLNNMYNPFFTTKSNGTGLGLSIVYQIILEHGGQITVESELNKGTTFRIFLPVYIKDKNIINNS